jgi:hypothetical protein
MLRLINLILVLVTIFNPIQIRLPVLPQDGENQPPGFQVRYHPDGPLFAGDQVSIQVFAPTAELKPNTILKVEVIEPRVVTLGESTASSQSAVTSQFTILWAWDTHNFAPGEYRLKYSLLPEDRSWEETVLLDSPAPGPVVKWETRETDCCILHYFSGSDAERDIIRLADMFDDRARMVKERLYYDTYLAASRLKHAQAPAVPAKLQINLIPRLLGQGGFASDEITVTYADENPAVSDVDLIIQHELTHRLDNDLGGENRPLMLMEGLAVYLSGGHYKPEPLFFRAAALLHDGGYIPLNILCEDFYSHQHETSYLEAAAWVGYMINTWGWDTLNQFYRDIHQKSGQSTSDAINDGLRRHYNLSLQEMDDRLQGWLETLPLIPDLLKDVQITSAYYDAIRSYQFAFDPSADFRQVWLPDPKEMRRKGITADYLRSPVAPINQAVTPLLHKIGQDWRTGQFSEAFNELQLVRSLTLEMQK